jgi:hypothetical protein
MDAENVSISGDMGKSFDRTIESIVRGDGSTAGGGCSGALSGSRTT